MKALMRRSRYLLVIALCLSAFAASEIAAETILLKNGQILSGKVVSQNKTSITIQTAGGRRTILKSAIQRIDYKSAEEVRRQEQERRRKLEAERRKKEAAERERQRIEAERRAREEAARKAQEEAEAEAARKAAEAEAARKAQEAAEADRKAREAAERNETETSDSQADAKTDPGRSLAELFGEAALGGGFEVHDAAAANFFYDGPTNRPGGNHLFERGMGSDGAVAPVIFYERSFWDPRIVPGIEAGFLYRRDVLRPGLLYPALSGWEFFVRPSIGARFGLTDDLSLHLRGYYAFAATQMGREFYGPEWTLDQGLVLDQLDGIQRYRIRNPQYAGPGLRVAFEFDRFRLWLGRQWLSGKAGDARIYRDNWIVGLGVKL